ncbi:DNA excision repair protein ERCC-1 isoform X2 [Heterocephalus glaber]|uniref:DNA excision repair protein ERCC-1 isoform X2 n=1 Tax=Heterocephalus glaber TaxID=10181 RepID=A0AAX6QHJ0_HETGA|nr:DNA excision repair protein ERCC-1 isoform X2 [Heterocephalus glaber]
MDPEKDEEGAPQPAGPPSRKKFVIPLDEDEVPPPGAKPLFKSTGNLPTMETSAQGAQQTYAEYAISQPAGGAAATCPTGSDSLAGETPNQALKPGAKSNSIIVSPRQRGNPVLKFVRNVPWEFGEVIPDYVLGQSTCALFLSLRYHNLHPDYIHERLQSLGKNFALRVLLVQVDVKDPQQALKELAKMCILADCTLILAWRNSFVSPAVSWPQGPHLIHRALLSCMVSCTPPDKETEAHRDPITGPRSPRGNWVGA